MAVLEMMWRHSRLAHQVPWRSGMQEFFPGGVIEREGGDPGLAIGWTTDPMGTRVTACP